MLLGILADRNSWRNKMSFIVQPAKECSWTYWQLILQSTIKVEVICDGII